MRLLRTGLAYDRSPVQDEYRTPRLPDSDRIWLAFGARYQPGPTMWFDFGYTYLFVDDASSHLQPPGPLPGTLNGTYTGDVQVLGVQATLPVLIRWGGRGRGGRRPHAGRCRGQIDPPRLDDPRFLSAAERTLPARRRTTIAPMGFGAVVGRLGLPNPPSTLAAPG